MWPCVTTIHGQRPQGHCGNAHMMQLTALVGRAQGKMKDFWGTVDKVNPPKDSGVHHQDVTVGPGDRRKHLKVNQRGATHDCV